MQLSIFQCRLDRKKLLRMVDSLQELINTNEDHLMVIDIGPADTVTIKVESFGRPYRPMEHNAIIV